MKDDFYGEIVKRVSQPGKGATIDVKNQQEARSGWAVARAGYEHVEPSQTFSETSLKRYAGENREPLEQAGHMGLWHTGGVAGRPSGVYHDVVDVKPNTYQGGLEAMVQGLGNQQDAIFNIDRLQEMYSSPKTRSQKRGTRQALRSLKEQRPGGRGSTLEDVPTKELGRAIRERQPATAPNIPMADPLTLEARRLAVRMRKGS